MRKTLECTWEPELARKTKLAPVSGLLLLVLSTAACVEPEVESADPAAEVAQDPILQALLSSGEWELAPTRAVIATEPPSDMAFTLTADEQAMLADIAEADATWYASDGSRYEAMFVLADGTAYGRRGRAPAMPKPTPENNYGGFPGLDGPAVEVDGGAEGAVYMNVNQDERIRRANTYPFYALQQFPARANGAMSGDGNTMSGGCSGTKIGPRAVLTASHCVLRPDGSWILPQVFNPGQTNTTTPNGSHAFVAAYARDFRIHRKWDYSVVFPADSSQFYYLGWLGIEWYTAAAYYTGMTSKNRGYPCGPNNSCGAITVQRCADSARADLRCDGWMYGMDLTMGSEAFWADDLLGYHNDVSFGHSGSAIYNQNSNVLGVVTHQEFQPGCENGCQWYHPCHGPRFRQEMWDDVCSWIADPAFQSVYGQHPICHW